MRSHGHVNHEHQHPVVYASPKPPSAVLLSLLLARCLFAPSHYLVYPFVQDALLAVTRSLGWGTLRTCWLDTCLAARSDHERYNLAGDSLRFVIANGGHVKAASFMLGVGGADANGVDSRLLSPLHLVAMFNRPDIARVLLMCGASPRLVGGVSRAAAARGGRLWSPLEMAEEACTEGGALDDGEREIGAPLLPCPRVLFFPRAAEGLRYQVSPFVRDFLADFRPFQQIRMFLGRSSFHQI